MLGDAMTFKKKNRREKLMTEVELELMTLLWRLESATVTEIQAELPPTRKLAYTSVSTIMRILEQKKFVGSRKEGRGHIYFPLLEKERYETLSVEHLVKRVFDGAPTGLARCLLETSELTADDLKSIRDLIDERLR